MATLTHATTRGLPATPAPAATSLRARLDVPARRTGTRWGVRLRTRTARSGAVGRALRAHRTRARAAPAPARPL